MRNHPIAAAVFVWVAIATLPACNVGTDVPSLDGADVPISTMTVAIDGDDHSLEVGLLSAEVIDGLPHAPLLGRMFHEGEYGGEAPPMAILSERVWRELMSARPEAIGSRIEIDDTAYTVIGVMPEGFEGSTGMELWLPRSGS